MHPLFHSFKRLHWSSMRFARDWASEYGTTPARLDAMLVIARVPGGISQSDIHVIVDVCAPVITRMLNSLEELDLVVRHNHPTDGRRNLVSLTPRGEMLVREAVRGLFRDGFTERCMWMAVAPGVTRHRTVLRALRRAREYCTHQRDYLSDRSVMRYPCYLPSGERSPEYPVRPSDGVFRARRSRRSRRPPRRPTPPRVTVVRPPPG